MFSLVEGSWEKVVGDNQGEIIRYTRKVAHIQFAFGHNVVKYVELCLKGSDWQVAEWGWILKASLDFECWPRGFLIVLVRRHKGLHFEASEQKKQIWKTLGRYTE